MAKTIKLLLTEALSETNNWKLKLLQHWPTILGNLQTKVHLEKIQDDILTLGVSDSCWLQELYMLSPLLLESINTKLDKPRIKSLRFKKIGFKQQSAQKNIKIQQRNSNIRPLTLQEEKALKKVGDQELQKLLTTFLHRCQQEM